jgi:lipid A 3-O-deacylase
MVRFLLTIFLLIVFIGCNEDKRHAIAPGDGRKPLSPGRSIVKTQTIITNIPVKKKKKKRGIKAETPSEFTVKSRQPDTSLVSRLAMYKALEIEPDLNEPLTRESFLVPVEGDLFNSMIEISKDKLFSAQGENDLLDNTDRFYTNGLRFDLVAPFFQASPLSRLLAPYWHPGKNYYGICLVQNMYTPSTTKVGGILYGDRPYAAYLYVGSYKITNDLKRKIRFTREIQLGVIGQSSLGEYVQKAFHNTVPTNNEPLGWEYQVSNDLLLNYQVSLEKGLLAKKAVEFNVNGIAILGTVMTNIGGGVSLRAGRFNPYFVNLGVEKRSVNRKKGLMNTQVFVSLKSSFRLIGYDATLEGGMFNKTSPYTIASSEMSRILFKSSLGLAFCYGGFRINLEQYLQSPEFKNGWWHKWVSLGMTFAL